MSFLSKLKSNAPHALGKQRNLTDVLIGKGELYAAAAGFGYIKGAYREKAMVKGLPVDLIAGLVATALAVGSEVYSHGRGMSTHLNAVADAGLMSYFNSIGTAYGAKQSGRQVYVLRAGAKAPVSIPGLDMVGALPQAVGGVYLSADEIAAFSAQR